MKKIALKVLLSVAIGASASAAFSLAACADNGVAMRRHTRSGWEREIQAVLTISLSG